jgi:hypothetical protein
VNPTAEVAHRLATRREERHRQAVNAVFHNLEQRLIHWRDLVAVTRGHGHEAARLDLVNSYAAAGFARATAALVDLGEN